MNEILDPKKSTLEISRFAWFRWFNPGSIRRIEIPNKVNSVVSDAMRLFRDSQAIEPSEVVITLTPNWLGTSVKVSISGSKA